MGLSDDDSRTDALPCNHCSAWPTRIMRRRIAASRVALLEQLVADLASRVSVLESILDDTVMSDMCDMARAIRHFIPKTSSHVVSKSTAAAEMFDIYSEGTCGLDMDESSSSSEADSASSLTRPALSSLAPLGGSCGQHVQHVRAIDREQLLRLRRCQPDSVDSRSNNLPVLVDAKDVFTTSCDADDGGMRATIDKVSCDEIDLANAPMDADVAERVRMVDDAAGVVDVPHIVADDLKYAGKRLSKSAKRRELRVAKLIDAEIATTIVDPCLSQLPPEIIGRLHQLCREALRAKIRGAHYRLTGFVLEEEETPQVRRVVETWLNNWVGNLMQREADGGTAVT